MAVEGKRTRLGHHVEEAAPEIDGAALASSYLHVYFGQIPAAVARAKALGARTADVELMNRVLCTLGESVSARKLTAQLGKWNEFARSLGCFHQRYDLLLTPTLAHPPIRHGEGDPPPGQKTLLDFLQRTGLLGLLARLGLLDGVVSQIARDNLRYAPFTQLERRGRRASGAQGRGDGRARLKNERKCKIIVELNVYI